MKAGLRNFNGGVFKVIEIATDEEVFKLTKEFGYPIIIEKNSKYDINKQFDFVITIVNDKN